jgi:hypothetical protein
MRHLRQWTPGDQAVCCRNVFARIFAWLLAVVVVTATAGHAYAQLDTAGEVPGVVDDGPRSSDSLEGFEACLPQPEPVATAAPPRPQRAVTPAPRSFADGRMHAVRIFRPPRPLAPR